MSYFRIKTDIYNTPEVLMIVLDRELDIQSKIKLKFDFQLNLFNCCWCLNKKYYIHLKLINKCIIIIVHKIYRR